MSTVEYDEEIDRKEATAQGYGWIGFLVGLVIVIVLPVFVGAMFYFK